MTRPLRALSALLCAAGVLNPAVVRATLSERITLAEASKAAAFVGIVTLEPKDVVTSRHGDTVRLCGIVYDAVPVLTLKGNSHPFQLLSLVPGDIIEDKNARYLVFAFTSERAPLETRCGKYAGLFLRDREQSVFHIRTSAPGREDVVSNRNGILTYEGMPFQRNDRTTGPYTELVFELAAVQSRLEEALRGHLP